MLRGPDSYRENHDLPDLIGTHTNHSAKAPVVCDEYWLISFSSLPNCTHQQTFLFYLTNDINSDSTLLRRSIHRPALYSPADEERFELSTLGLTSRSSAIELFIQCWPEQIRTVTSWLRRPMHFHYATGHWSCKLARRDSNSQLPV